MKKLPGLLLLFFLTVSASADRLVLGANPQHFLAEPNQTAVVAYRQGEQLLILATSLQTKQPTSLVEILPFPTEPKVSAGNPKLLNEIAALLDEGLLNKGPVLRSSANSSGFQVLQEQQIGAHSISVLKLDDLESLQSYCVTKIRRKLTPVEEQLVRDYLERDYRYFVLDSVNLKKQEALQPLLYRFKTDKVFYPFKTSRLIREKGRVQLLLLTDVHNSGRALNKRLGKSAVNICYEAMKTQTMEEDSHLPWRGHSNYQVPPIATDPSFLRQSELKRLDEALVSFFPHGAIASLAIYNGPLSFNWDLAEGVTGEPSRSSPIPGSEFVKVIKAGQTQTAIKMLNRDPDLVHERLDQFRTPLHLASESGEIRLARLLINRGLNPSQPDLKGWTPLHLAAQNNQQDVIEYLMSKGAKATVPTKDGIVPAALTSSKEIATFLLDRMTPKQRSNFSEPVIKCGNLELLKLFPELGNKTKPNSLHLAAESGHVDMASYLIQQGSRPDRYLRRHGEPLFAACKFGHLEMVKFLIESGVDPKEPSSFSIPYWHKPSVQHLYPTDVAAAHSGPEVLEYLISQGVSLGPISYLKRGTLHRAAQAEEPEVLKLLLARDVDVNAADKEGNTPLHLAYRLRRTENVKLLLKAGADSEKLNKKGEKPGQR